jgi:hypothetical protein
MTEPDEALLWAREQSALPAVQTVMAYAYRAGAAASADRIKELEARVAELEDMASRYLIQMSDMLTRLNERYPEDFVWLKEPDQ